MSVKNLIARIINNIRSNRLHKADRDTTHVMAQVKYPKPIYMRAMLLKGELKKAIDYGPKFKTKTIRPLLNAEHNLINALKVSEHQVTNNGQKD